MVQGEGTNPQVGKVTVEEFARRIKEKYPQYIDVDDLELTQRIIDKYPQYKDTVSFEPPAVKKKDAAIPSAPLDGASPSQKTKEFVVEDGVKRPKVTIGDWWGDKWNGLVEGVSDFMYSFRTQNNMNGAKIASFIEEKKDKYPEFYNLYQQKLQESSDFWRQRGYSDDMIRSTIANSAYVDYWQDHKEIENELVPFIRQKGREEDVADVGIDIDKAVQKELDKRFLSTSIKGLAASIPAMVTSASTLGGSFVTTAYYQADEELKRNLAENPNLEMSKAQQEAYKVTIGGMMGVLERIGLSRAIQGTPIVKDILGKKVFTRLAGMGGDVTSEAFERVVKEEVKGLKGYVSKTAGGSLAEFETGALQQLFQDVTNEFVNAATGQQIFTPKTAMQIIEDTFYAGAQEAVGGGIISGTVGALSRPDITTIEDFEKAETLIKGINQGELEIDIKRRVRLGEITQEQGDNILKSAKEFSEAYNKLPDDLSQQDKVEMYRLINKKLKLRQSVEGKDEAIQRRVNKDIAVIDDQIVNLYEKSQAEIDTAVESEKVDVQAVEEGTTSGEEVFSFVEEITPQEEDVPTGFEGKIKERNFRESEVDLQELLNSDPDFKDFYDNFQQRYEEGEVDTEGLGLNLVVVDGELLDGYNRAATLLSEGQTKTNAFIAVDKVEPKVVSQRSTPEYVEAKVAEQPIEDPAKLTEELQGQFGLLTAENPMAKELSEEENAELNKKAEAWLKERNYSPRKVSGRYEGIAENSFFVPNLTMSDAIAFAKEFNQDSVAHSEGLVDQQGKMYARVKSDDVLDFAEFQAESDFVSTVNTAEGAKTFKIGYNFKDGQVDAIKTTSPKDTAVKAAPNKKLQTMVSNFNKVIKKIGAQPYNITFAANNKEYEARYRELTGKEKPANRGTFIGGKREIIINLSSANEGTLAHEMMHAYLHALNITGKNILQLTNALYTELSTGSAIEKQIARELRKFQEEYIKRNIYGQNKTLEDPNIAEEFLTEYVGIMVQYSERVPASGKVSFAEKIRKAVLKFLTKLGIKDKSILQAIETREEAVNFINGFVNVLSDRAEVADLPGFLAEQGKSGEVGTIKVPTSSEQIEIIDAPKASEDSRSFIRNFVTDIKIKSLQGRKFVTNMYDYTNAGITQLGKGLSINLLGGRNYVPLMMERTGKKIGEVSNLAAFNTKEQAEGFIRNAKEGKADLFAPHSGTLSDSWQFQHNIFQEMTNLVLENKILSKSELINIFNEALKSKEGQKQFKQFNDRNGTRLKNFNSFKKDPMKLVELLDAENNYSPKLRKALNDKIAASKKVQKALGIKNKQQFQQLIADPMNQGVVGGEIMTFVEFDPKTFEIVKTKQGDPDHHPSFGWTVKAKIKAIYQPDKYYKSYDLTNEYTKYNTEEVKTSRKTDASEAEFIISNVNSSAGAIPKVAKVDIDSKEQIDFAGIEMKVQEVPAGTSANIPTGGVAYVPVSKLYNLMDMRDGDRGGLYETDRDKKRVAKIAERFKKEGFNNIDSGYQTIYVDVDAGGFGWIGEGNHRVLAARQLGMTHLPVRVEFGAARDGKFIYHKNYSRVPTQVVTEQKIEQLKEQAGKYYHIKYASIWETNLPTNQEPVTKDQIDWQPSPFGQGNPAIVNRTPEIQQAAIDLLNGEIDNAEYQELVKIYQPIEPITTFFLPASTKDMKNALDSNKAKLLNEPIKDGTEVGLRLDIPAYKNKNIWVVSVHDKGKSGKSISYGSVAWATDVNFGSNPTIAAFIASGYNMDMSRKLKVVKRRSDGKKLRGMGKFLDDQLSNDTGVTYEVVNQKNGKVLGTFKNENDAYNFFFKEIKQSKTTIARMFGKWKNFEGKTKEERDAAAVKKVEEIQEINSTYPRFMQGKPWRQIGMNPFRHSFFYDRANGNPVVYASEVVQIGGLVYAKDVVYAKKDDPMFEVDGYKDSRGETVRFQIDEKTNEAFESRQSIGEKIFGADIDSEVDNQVSQNGSWKSRPRTAFEKFVDLTRLRIQDKFRRLIIVQEDIEHSSGKPVGLDQDFRNAEALMHGKAKEELNKSEERVAKIAKLIKAAGIKIEKFNELLYAMHAQERNRYLRIASTDVGASLAKLRKKLKIKPSEIAEQLGITTQEYLDIEANKEVLTTDNLKYLLQIYGTSSSEFFYENAAVKDGSGMTDKEARTILAEYGMDVVDPESSQLPAKLKAAVEAVYDLTADTRQRLLDSGLETPETIEVFETTYKNYIPLRGFAEGDLDSEIIEGGRKLEVRGREKRAKGRKTKADDPLTQAVIANTTTIVRAEKNSVMNRFYNLAKNNPNQDVYKVIDPKIDKEYKTEDRGGKLRRTAKTVADYLLDPNVVAVRVDGDYKFIRFKDKRLADALRGANVVKADFMVKYLGQFNRMLSSFITTYDPEFVLRNFSRDIQTAVMNLYAEQEISEGLIKDKNIVAKVVSDTLPALRSIFAVEGGITGKKKTSKNKEMDQYYREFKEDGAKTEWFYSKSSSEVQNDIENLIKGKGTNALQAAGNLVERINSSVENAVRLSTYVNARKAGVSRAKAAELAKGLTVNFNKSGEWGQIGNTLYLFFNASVQGTSRLIRALKPRFKVDSEGNRSLQVTTAQKMAIGLSILGSLLSVLNELTSDDDEDGESFYSKIADFEKERNIIIMKPNGKDYFKIPLPYGVNVFYVAGTLLADAAQKIKTPGEAAVGIMESALGSFSPINFPTSSDVPKFLAKFVTPTVGQIPLSLAINENYFGQTIYNQNFPFDTSPKPESELGRKGSNRWTQEFVKFMNKATGGSAFRPGAIDINPDKIDFVMESLSGGMGKFVGRSANVVDKVITGNWDELEARQVPFLRVFYGQSPKYANVQDFYSRSVLVNQMYEEVKEKVITDPIARRKISKMYYLGKNLRKQLKNIKEKEDLAMKIKDPELQQARLEKLESARYRLVANYNKQYTTFEIDKLK